MRVVSRPRGPNSGGSLNYVSALLDEIALEGLDGVTVDDLDLRLKRRAAAEVIERARVRTLTGDAPIGRWIVCKPCFKIKIDTIYADFQNFETGTLVFYF